MVKLGCFLVVGIALLGTMSPSLAGGFQRGQADTDLLYEPGSVSSRVGFAYIRPDRGFETINGVAGDYGTYVGNYRVPSLALKVGGDPLACVGTYVRSFAAQADYTGSPGGALPVPAGSGLGARNRRMEFASDEIAGTCRASFDAGRQRFSLLGGVYVEDFDFSASSLATVPSGRAVRTSLGGLPIYLPAQIDAEAGSGFSPGFRAGLAYEIPDISLRAQVLYRSQTTHETPDGSASGTLAGAPFVVVPNAGRVDLASPMPLGSPLPIPSDFRLDDVVSPQSVGVSVQSGIAPGTLLTASLRWTDWSTNRALVSQLGEGAASVTPFRWRDGYTASLGIGRIVTEKVSVSLAAGFDGGVSTGAETTYTDLYTLSGGVSFKQGVGEVRLGGLIGYWTKGAQKIAQGAQFDAAVGADLVSAASASLKFSF